MASKSWLRISSVKSRVSRRQLGHQSDPVIYAESDCRSHRNRKTRKSEESLERASKRTRRSPFEGCSQAFSGPSASAHSSSSSSVYTDAPEMPEETQSLSRSSSEAQFTVDVTTSSEKTPKRKSEDSPERGSKRSRRSQSPREGCSQAFSEPSSSAHSSSSSSVYTDVPEMPEESRSLSRSSSEAELTVDVKTSSEKTPKRKSESLERPSKRSRGSPSPGPSHRACSSDGPSTSSSSNSVPSNSLDAFEAKYRVQEMLGQGSYGSVFAGERKKDNLPVAIKEIPQYTVTSTPMLLNGKMTMVPLEVALMLRLKTTESETSAVVTLLDWFDLEDVLILVLERPDPCMDLLDYIYSGQNPMKEHKAKIITSQLVDALIEIHSKGVFHGDIKTDNILIETGSGVPRVRIIDFGCGAFLSDAIHAQRKVFLCSPPESWRDDTSRPEPTTVWQLGLVLFEMLHRFFPFQNAFAITDRDVFMNNSLSEECQDFILSCLMKDPDARPTFAMLKDHPWLM